jgi:hypothetical protein
MSCFFSPALQATAFLNQTTTNQAGQPDPRLLFELVKMVLFYAVILVRVAVLGIGIVVVAWRSYSDDGDVQLRMQILRLILVYVHSSIHK